MVCVVLLMCGARVAGSGAGTEIRVVVLSEYTSVCRSRRLTEALQSAFSHEFMKEGGRVRAAARLACHCQPLGPVAPVAEERHVQCTELLLVERALVS